MFSFGKKPTKASLLMPTRGRAKFFDERLGHLWDLTPELFDGRAELVVVADWDDQETCNYPYQGEYELVICDVEPEPKWPGEKWNIAAQAAKHDWWVLWADDAWPKNKGWLTEALNTPNQGYIGLPDDACSWSRNKQFCPSWIASRQWCEEHQGGYIIAPHYKSWFGDLEIAEIARAAGHYVVAWRAPVTQKHVCFNTARPDATYNRARPAQVLDKVLYEKRKEIGFPWK